MKIGQFAQAAALERAIERRQHDLNVTQGFLRKIERAAIRRNVRLDRMVSRAGMEERAIPRVVLAGIRRVSEEINQLPRSGRALTRLRRSEAKAVLRVIEKLIRRQRRIETLLAREQVWRRQIARRLRATDAVLPLINAGHLDRLEDLLARRRGTGSKNKHAQMLGRLRAKVRPYSRERMIEISRLGAVARTAAVKARWARVQQQERSNQNGNINGDRGAAGGTGDAAGADVGAANGPES
jgi:hypothetical protein